MSNASKIEIPVEAVTAAALADDARRREAVGRLVDRLVRPAPGDDPLLALFDRTSAEAREAGLSEADIAAELAAHKEERRG